MLIGILGFFLLNLCFAMINYLPEADVVTLNVQGVTSQLAARWYNPRSGQKVEVNGEIEDGTHKFQPPDDFGHGDAVLHVSHW
jgi:hypothetical protein